MKKSLNEIMKQLERMAQQTSHEVQAEEMKKGIAEAVTEMERETKVVIAGGSNNGKELNSVEIFSLTTRTWTHYSQQKHAAVKHLQLFTRIKLLSLEAQVSLWKNYH